ncbi:MAG: hypothetical protein J3Q66DRAFT_331657 [Benniella sp.]|nr:MAG: hypothetical protein J3Q66DRAFT_331657 [Benniella sp.]
MGNKLSIPSEHDDEPRYDNVPDIVCFHLHDDPKTVCFQCQGRLHKPSVPSERHESRYNDDVPNILDQTSPVEDILPSDVGSGKPANNGSISDEDTLGTSDTTDKKPSVDITKLSHAESGQPVQTPPVESAQPSVVEIEQSAHNATVSSEVIPDQAPPVNAALSGNSPHDDQNSADNAPRPDKTVSDMVQSANDDSSAQSLWQSSNNASRSGEGIVNNLFFEQSVRHERSTVVTPITVDPNDPMFHRRVRKDVSSPNVWQTAKMIFSMKAAASGEVVRE